MPFSVEGARYIAIKKEVFIKPNAWLLALNYSDSTSKDTKLSIDEGTYIGRNAHIVSLKSIRIGKNVLMGDNVYIADNFHRFDKVDLPYKEQGVGFKSEVEIGDGTWLGENVCVISSKIGKQCIVGANSLVIHDVPDYCMVAGSPARIIRHTTTLNKVGKGPKIVMKLASKHLKFSWLPMLFLVLTAGSMVFIFRKEMLYFVFLFSSLFVIKNLYKRELLIFVQLLVLFLSLLTFNYLFASITSINTKVIG